MVHRPFPVTPKAHRRFAASTPLLEQRLSLLGQQIKLANLAGDTRGTIKAASAALTLCSREFLRNARLSRKLKSKASNELS
jgi:hypothetical protein